MSSPQSEILPLNEADDARLPSAGTIPKEARAAPESESHPGSGSEISGAEGTGSSVSRIVPDTNEDSPEYRLRAAAAVAETDDLDQVRLILERGQVNINEKEPGDRAFAAIHHAAKNGNAAIMSLLVNHPGIDVNVQDARGRTALHYAIEGKHREVLKRLLSNPQIDLFAKSSDQDGTTPWTMALLEVSKISKETKWYDSSKLTEACNADIPWMLRSGGSELSRPSNDDLLDFDIPRWYFRMLVQRAIAIAEEPGLESEDVSLLLDFQIFLSFYENFIYRYRSVTRSSYHTPDWFFQRGFQRAYQKGSGFLNGLVEDYGISVRMHGISKRRKIATLWHVTTHYGFHQELKTLLGLQEFKESINVRDTVFQMTALDLAVRLRDMTTVTMLLEEKTLRAAEKGANVTPLEYATEMQGAWYMNDEKWNGIEDLLIERAEVQRYVDNLYRDRQVYVDAANAILVGAALIASVTFAGWLQPPLGYTTYYQEFYSYPAPPGTTESFAGVEQHLSIRVFWAFNSLSFFSAIATVVAGAATVLPSTNQFIKREVRVVRKWLIFTSALLSTSLVCVLGAFCAAGFAVLPPIAKYRSNMTGTTCVGMILCLGVLLAFLSKLSSLITRHSRFAVACYKEGSFGHVWTCECC